MCVCVCECVGVFELFCGAEQDALGGQPVLMRPSVSDALSGVGSPALVDTGRQKPPGHRQMPGLLCLLSEKDGVGCGRGCQEARNLMQKHCLSLPSRLTSWHSELLFGPLATQGKRAGVSFWVLPS